MARDAMIKRAAEAVGHDDWCHSRGCDDCPPCTLREPRCDVWRNAEVALDAMLPQITTVEEVQELPARSVIVGANGYALTLGVVNKADGWQRWIAELIRNHGPFALVWRPS